jgi:hypothetical protein
VSASSVGAAWLPEDPGRLSPAQRRREIAALLARGTLRLQSVARVARDSAPSVAAEHAPEPALKALEVSGTSRPHVTDG